MPIKSSEDQKSETTEMAGRICLSVQESAHAMGVSDASVRRLIARGLLKPSRVLRHLRIPVHQLHDLMK